MGPTATGTRIAAWPLQFTGAFSTASFTLTDAQFAAITNWGNLYVTVIASGVQTTVSWIRLEAPVRGASPGAGTLTLVGVAPITGARQPGAGTMAFSGVAPSVERSYTVYPPVGAMRLAGVAPESIATSDPGRGTLSLTGLAPTTSRGTDPYVLGAVRGEFAFSGLQPTITVAVNRLPAAATLTLTGVAPTLNRMIVVPVGTMAMAGGSVLITESSPVAIAKTVPTGTLTLAGTTPLGVVREPGPLAIQWGTETLVQAGWVSDVLVSAQLPNDELEYYA
jgi:hypothetical protein